MNEIYCEECEAEFQVVHDSVSEPQFCPFCGEKLKIAHDEDEDNWYDDGE